MIVTNSINYTAIFKAHLRMNNAKAKITCSLVPLVDEVIPIIQTFKIVNYKM